MNKIISISYMRVTAMLMVVALHSLCYYGNWGFRECVIQSYLDFSSLLNDIAMPIFMCISGYLFVRSIERHEQKKRIFLMVKFKRLIIPYIVWGILQIILLPNRYNYRQLFFGVSHLWFLLTLFWIFLIMIFTRKYWSNFSFKYNMLLVIVLFFLYPLSQFSHNFLRIASVVKYLPFFVMGIMIYKNQTIKDDNIKKCIIIVSLLLMTLLKFTHVDMISEHLKYETCQMLGWIMFFLFFDIFIKKANLPQTKRIEYIDKCSMGIYIIHHVVIIYALQIESVRVFLNNYWQIGPLVVFFISLIVSLILTVILQSNKYTNYLIG